MLDSLSAGAGVVVGACAGVSVSQMRASGPRSQERDQRLCEARSGVAVYGLLRARGFRADVLIATDLTQRAWNIGVDGQSHAWLSSRRRLLLLDVDVLYTYQPYAMIKIKVFSHGYGPSSQS